MNNVKRGFIWSAVDHLSVQGLQFIISILLARLILPESYGVVVIVQVFMSFAQVFIDGGFKSALIQKQDRNERDYSTVFILNLLVALILYLLLFFAAPYIAMFYNQPQLKNMTRVIALNLVFSSLSITQLIRLQVVLDFKTQAKARIVSVIISGAAGIYFAFKGYEAWALVIQGVLCSFLTSFMLFNFIRWKPTFVFSKESFTHLFKFGSKVLFSNFLTTLYMQISNLVIGKFYTPSQLAFYNRGFTLSNVPSVSIVEVMGRTIYPIFCECQKNDSELKIIYRKYLRLVNIIVIPSLLLVAALSTPLIRVILTDKWIETAPLLSIFCIAFATYPSQYITGNLILSVGKSGLLARANILKQIIAFSLLIIALFISVKAVAFSLLFSNILNFFIGFYCVKISKSIPVKQQICYILPIIVISLFSCLCAWLFSLIFENALLKLFFGFAIGIIVFFVSSLIFKMEEMKILLGYINNENK